MKIAVFGGTRGVGAQVVEQAVKRGHSCRVLARNPESVPDLPEVVAIKGDVLDPDAVSRVLEGCEAVVISLGPTRKSPPTVCSEGTRLIIEAMQRHGIQRVVAVSSMGVGESAQQVPLFFKIVSAIFLRGVMKDKEAQEKILKESPLDWTIVRPGGLFDGPPTGNYQAGVDVDTIAARISRADVASFVLIQLDDETYLRQAPHVT
ncbi:epimerase [Ectothiorhodospira haloalkaliphila]|uniref:Epimerase n=1 Tax=Ectothiorhodospira haloalkaliphila TaxID=421628 RepID=W8KW55_9GAMM|nr:MULTISPECIES: SDR family oxidoreductase [Ectothiorhodospira]AHK79791.1 epimerase [Ectothiorhodospira haloalkaliphila]MCG5497974.1 SDR family oxidoreductase [Ectothiorhodospira variabilis]MCG5524256.1 SDR family oxidoreductase [Ectothiorhodospira haloalkaliphila]